MGSGKHCVTLSEAKGRLPSPEASGEGLGVRAEILRLRLRMTDWGQSAVGSRQWKVLVTLSEAKGLLPSPEASGEGLGVRAEILRFPATLSHLIPQKERQWDGLPHSHCPIKGETAR